MSDKNDIKQDQVKDSRHDGDPIEDLDVTSEEADAVRAGLGVQPTDILVTKPTDRAS